MALTGHVKALVDGSIIANRGKTAMSAKVFTRLA